MLVVEPVGTRLGPGLLSVRCLEASIAGYIADSAVEVVERTRMVRKVDVEAGMFAEVGRTVPVDHIAAVVVAEVDRIDAVAVAVVDTAAVAVAPVSPSDTPAQPPSQYPPLAR